MNGITKITKPLILVTKKGLRFVTKNSNVILTVVSVGGVVSTVVCAVKGTIKAVKLCEEKKVVDRKEVVETVWKCYIPTVGLALLTTTAIVCNGKINAKRIAVLSSAYAGSVDALKKVEERMSEQIGPKKTQRAVDEAETAIAQENTPKRKEDIIATGKGTQLFLCRSTGQWFYSDRNGVELANERFRKRFEEAKNDWGSGEWVPVSEAQEVLGLPSTDMGEFMGWYTDDFPDKNTAPAFVISSDWVDLPWGREVVGIVRFTPWPTNM